MTSISINTKNRTIELSNAFTKAASIFGSDEYRQLQEARRDYPSYRVVTIKQKNTSSAEFMKLSYKFMDKYVKEHLEDNALKAEYLDLRGLDENWEKNENVIPAGFQIIKDWFMNTFPEFEKFHTDRKALLEKIEAKKKARLEARKRAS